MKKYSEELLKEFHKEVEEDFPEVTPEQLKEVVYGPWKFLKGEMENGELITIRFKYFGTFRVYQGRAKGLLVRLEKKFKQLTIEPKEYFRIKEMLEKFIKND